MKKFFIAAVAVIGSVAVANAQLAEKNSGKQDDCSGCTANTYDKCETPVTVSLANVLKMTCDGCTSLSGCANTIEDWKKGLNLGSATFNIASTKSYSVFAGVDQPFLQSGATKITIGTANGNVPLYAQVVANSTGGSATAGQVLLTHATSSSNKNNAGAKVINAAPASLINKSATLGISTGALPLNTPNGDYTVNVVVSAIQD